VTQEIDNLTLKKQLLKEWNDGNGTLGHYPLRTRTSSKLRKTDPASLSAAALTGWLLAPLLGASSTSNIHIPG
jgi:hypothetical protein